MPHYNASREEDDAYLYCTRKGIRISPGAVKGGNKWTIDVSLDGLRWHKSPKEYGRENIWEEVYKMCAYYYNKRKK